MDLARDGLACLAFLEVWDRVLARVPGLQARMHKLEVQGIIALASSGHERREKVAAYKDKHSAELQAFSSSCEDFSGAVCELLL